MKEWFDLLYAVAKFAFLWYGLFLLLSFWRDSRRADKSEHDVTRTLILACFYVLLGKP